MFFVLLEPHREDECNAEVDWYPLARARPGVRSGAAPITHIPPRCRARPHVYVRRRDRIPSNDWKYGLTI